MMADTSDYFQIVDCEQPSAASLWCRAWFRPAPAELADSRLLTACLHLPTRSRNQMLKPAINYLGEYDQLIMS